MNRVFGTPNILSLMDSIGIGYRLHSASAHIRKTAGEQKHCLAASIMEIPRYMTQLTRTNLFCTGCLILFLTLPKAAISNDWYVGLGITDLSLSVTSTSVSFSAINALSGAQTGDGAIDVRAGSAVPTLSIGRTFGKQSQWVVETTLAQGFDETFFSGGQEFASADLLPLVLIGAYQAKTYSFGSGAVSLRPLIGGGITYAYHRSPKLASSQLSAGQSADIGISGSFGLAAVAGMNISLKSRTSVLLALTYLDGIQADVSLENLDLSVPFVTVQPTVSLGGVQLDGVALTARLQYQF
ncbi:MAG: OmpW family outer membrane protein [Granulosicoccus sp.]